ncbi:floral homeotic protein agamous [Kockiozyma suomiensis]|uniref:floral homeotic protein agamous n=1 Tax=Kockiozyma suomiensis TaxID=1337062 RepID=UPI003343E182
MPPKPEDLLLDNPQQHNVKPPRDDEDDDDEETSRPGRERRKIEIKFIDDKSRRHITFSKRKAGIMKKPACCFLLCHVHVLFAASFCDVDLALSSDLAYELSVLTGTQVLLLVVSETGLVYTFTTPKLQPLVTKAEGKNLIQACLNAPEEPVPTGPHSQEPQQPPMVDDLPQDDHSLAAATAQQRAVAAAVAQQQQQQRAAQAQAMNMRPGMYPYPVQGLQDRDKEF